MRVDEKTLTPYDAFELWFYGSVAHANDDKTDEWDMRNADAIQNPLLRVFVQDFLMESLAPINMVAQLAIALLDATEDRGLL